ncbi:hypothetical protein Gotri_003448 [Gossypium trilobum]|uniref:Uncharacterized protein n=1 Tax=Gossypium trilobum TaxID=34281 RepID=A0A7J9F1I5_9ROSI|nr:hypothetical protein [Gossypium trilobum]
MVSNTYATRRLSLFSFFTIASCLSKTPTATNSGTVPPPSALVLASIYVSIGLLLAFNVFFSYFLNSQKFTPSVINSLILLVSHEDSSTPNGVSRGKSVIGFICTIVASAGNGLYLSLTHFCFQKVIKRESFYQSLVASSAIMLGLFVTGEWKSLKGEMEEHELGKTSYIMVLVWMCILWQGFTIGSTALLFEVSSLFSNSVSAIALPVIPILAVIFHMSTSIILMTESLRVNTPT